MTIQGDSSAQRMLQIDTSTQKAVPMNVAARCQRYTELFSCCPDSTRRSAVGLACGLVRPAVTTAGAAIARARRAETRAFFHAALEEAEQEQDPAERRAALEGLLRRALPFGPTAACGRAICLRLIETCVADGDVDAARQHLESARFLGWGPRPSDLKLLAALPSILDEVLANGDHSELRDGYAQLLEAVRVLTRQPAQAAALQDCRAQLRLFEAHLGIRDPAAVAAGHQEPWLNEAAETIESIRHEYPAVYREAVRLLRECRAGVGESGAEQRDCLRRLLEYPWFGAPAGDVAQAPMDLAALSDGDVAHITEVLSGVYGHEAAKFRHIPDALGTLAINLRERGRQEGGRGRRFQ